MDNSNLQDYFFFIVLVFVMLFMVKQIYPQNQEPFVDIDKEIKYLTQESEKTLKNFREDSSLFSQFCKKVKYFDDNYDESSKIFQLNKDLKKNIIEKQKKKQENLLNEIFEIQKKIYFDKDEIDKIVEYNKKVDSKTKKYTDILDKAIDNLKKNLNSGIILNIK